MADDNKTTATEIYIASSKMAARVWYAVHDRNRHSHILSTAVGDGGERRRHQRKASARRRFVSARAGALRAREKMVELAEAIRKMTSSPAARIGLKDRGILAAGKKADLVIFDAKNVLDQATFTKPFEAPIGIVHVFVNGEQVVKDSQVTGATSGQVLKIR